MSHRVVLLPDGIAGDAQAGETVLDCAHRLGVTIATACGGRGTCRSCLVHVPDGGLSEPEGGEARLIAEGRLPPNWRQACQARIAGPCTVEIPARSRAKAARTEIGGTEAPVAADPLVAAVEVTLTPAKDGDAADADRMAAAVGGALDIDIAVARALPRQLREWQWQARAIVRHPTEVVMPAKAGIQGQAPEPPALDPRLRGGDKKRIGGDDERRRGDGTSELIALLPPGRRPLGLAVDLGTTNLAGFLVDLESGQLLGTRGVANPQSRHGADVISRLGAGDKGLGAAAAQAIGDLATSLAAEAGGSAADVVDVVVAGNTAMHHLLLGLPTDWLGRVPFVPAVSAPLDVKARDLGIAVAPGASVHLLANIAGFVGGDHVACLLATEELWRTGTSLVLDVGTNTEISVIVDGRIVSASCPSGPAFEGGHIACGMRAASGAIEKLRVTADGGIEVHTIDDAPAVGICGSGLIDAIAELHGAGLIDARGRIRDGAEVALAPGVVLTQHDVRALQVAKAAVRAGCDLLLAAVEKRETEVDRIVVAGAFGSYLDLRRTMAIGMLPRLPLERFHQVGNAAGVGARMALASRAQRRRAAEIGASARHLSLASDKTFQNTFMRRINLD